MLSVNLKIAQGMANVEDVRMEGSSVGLALAGSASIPARDLDLRGTASLLAMSTSGTAAPAFELPFMVQGPWDDPIICRTRRAASCAPARRSPFSTRCATAACAIRSARRSSG